MLFVSESTFPVSRLQERCIPKSKVLAVRWLIVQGGMVCACKDCAISPEHGVGGQGDTNME